MLIPGASQYSPNLISVMGIGLGKSELIILVSGRRMEWGGVSWVLKSLWFGLRAYGRGLSVCVSV